MSTIPSSTIEPAQGEQRLRIPGFGLPVNYQHAIGNSSTPVSAGSVPFPHALRYWKARAVTVREKNMLAMINEVTDKGEWRRKVFDKNIVEKWKSEFVNDLGGNRTEHQWKEFGQVFTVEMFNFCIEELRHKARLHEETGMTLVLNTDTGVVKSDAAVSLELKQQLRAAVKLLEDVPDSQKDWHPGSNDTVLNIVDPSLFPLVYGRTRVLPHGTISLDDCLQSFTLGEQTQVPPRKDAQSETFVDHDANTFSTKFQWLPCAVRFEEDNSVKITSYINNLHPAEHKDLYHALEHLIAAALPLWSLVLGYTRSHEDARWTFRDDLRVPSATGPQWSACNWTPTTTAQEEAEELLLAAQERAMASRFLYMPSPRAFSASAMPEPATDLRALYASTGGLQVIVRITAVHLTPQHPRYACGGPWDIKGHHLNERIAATALYCYDSANVVDSASTPTDNSSAGRLSFRQRIEREHIRSLPSSDLGGIEFIYGIDADGGPAVQEVGDVSMREGRMLAFPNVLQCRVRPLELADKMKPGYCKVVEVLLVDPARRVLSTANVAPQQKGWWEGEVRGSGVLGRLPEELVQQILNEVEDWPIMGVEEARGLRAEMAEERESFREVMERAIESHRFDLRER